MVNNLECEHSASYTKGSLILWMKCLSVTIKYLMKATEQFFCVHFWLGGSEIPKCRHSNESLRTAHDTFYLFIYFITEWNLELS